MKPVKYGTKTWKVLAYLQTGHSLDIPKAIGMWGHIRLSDVIFRLRKKGYPITTEIVTNGNVEYAIYRLNKAPKKLQVGDKVKVLVGCFTGCKGAIEEFLKDSPEIALVRLEKCTDRYSFNITELEAI